MIPVVETTCRASQAGNLPARGFAELPAAKLRRNIGSAAGPVNRKKSLFPWFPD